MIRNMMSWVALLVLAVSMSGCASTGILNGAM